MFPFQLCVYISSKQYKFTTYKVLLQRPTANTTTIGMKAGQTANTTFGDEDNEVDGIEYKIKLKKKNNYNKKKIKYK